MISRWVSLLLSLPRRWRPQRFRSSPRSWAQSPFDLARCALESRQALSSALSGDPGPLARRVAAGEPLHLSPAALGLCKDILDAVAEGSAPRSAAKALALAEGIGFPPRPALSPGLGFLALCLCESPQEILASDSGTAILERFSESLRLELGHADASDPFFRRERALSASATHLSRAGAQAPLILQALLDLPPPHGQALLRPASGFLCGFFLSLLRAPADPSGGALACARLLSGLSFGGAEAARSCSDHLAYFSGSAALSGRPGALALEAIALAVRSFPEPFAESFLREAESEEGLGEREIPRRLALLLRSAAVASEMAAALPLGESARKPRRGL